MEESPSPNDPMVGALRNEWHKIIAVLLWKYKLDPAIITVQDMQDFQDAYNGNVDVFADGRGAVGLKLRLLRRV